MWSRPVLLPGLAAAWLLAACVDAFAAESVVLHSGRARIGDPDAAEWEWFEKDRAQQTALELRFVAKPNPTEATLFIRQQDVKLDWRVSLNGKVIGKLSPMEHDLVHWLVVPPAALRDEENVLSISTLPENRDDIVVHDVVLDSRPVAEAIGQASLRVTVRGQDGKPLPARVTITDNEGTLVPLIALPGEPLAVRSGVAYTGNGQAGLGLRPGKYKVHATRGFEYGLATATVELRAGETKSVDLQIAREVSTPGWVASDTHIHTLTLSGHGDSTLDERMLTIAGEGIELPVATEHNRHADYAEAAQRMGVAAHFTTVRGNEFTTSRGHFNVFPVDPGAPVPEAKLTAWPDILRAARATSGARVLQLNHPRDLHNKFRPFDPVNFNAETGENPAGLDLNFDLVEALNSGAQQTDYMLVLRDWFALLNRGHRITAVGASDSHDVSRFIVGQSRTYIQVPDTNPGGIDIAAACDALKAGRASISMGLLPEIQVEGKHGVGDLARDLPETIRVHVNVLGPAWVRADRVELFANGERIKDEAIAAERGSAAGVKAEFEWSIPRPNKDTHLVVIATGPAVTAPFWMMTRPYQPASTKWQGRAIGVTNPVWLDGDADGKLTVLAAVSGKLSRDRLLEFAQAGGAISAVKTIGDWERRRAAILEGARELMGPLPGPEKACALDPQVTEEVDCGSYVRRLLTYAAEPGSRVPAFLLIPKRALTGGERAPAVLCLHPTDNKIGHGVVAGLGGKANRQYAVELAERGFVTIAPAYPQLANYQLELAALGYVSGTMKAIHDNRRALDLLDSLPFVQPGKYAAIGHSLGGHNSVYTALFDSRLKVVVSSCGLDSYRDYKGGDIRGWTSSRYMPRLLQWKDRLSEVPVDFPEMVAALAPRHVLIIAPVKDDNFRADSVDRIAAAARPVFALLGGADRLAVEHPDCDHDFPDAARETAYRLIESVLRK